MMIVRLYGRHRLGYGRRDETDDTEIAITESRVHRPIGREITGSELGNYYHYLTGKGQRPRCAALHFAEARFFSLRTIDHERMDPALLVARETLNGKRKEWA